MEDFVLGLKHRTVLWGKAEFNVARAEHPVSENHNHLTVWNPTPAPVSGTLAEHRRPRKHAAFIIYLYTHQA